MRAIVPVRRATRGFADPGHWVTRSRRMKRAPARTTDREAMRERFEWALLLATGAFLSVQIARRVTDAVGMAATEEPVRAMIEEVLAEEPAADSPMARAFAEALDGAENGVGT